MKLQGKLADVSIDFETRKPKITFLINNNITSLEEIENVELLDIEAKKHRNKRSKDANNYFWKLCTDLAEKLDMNKDDVYRSYIQQQNVFKDVEISSNATDTFITAWKMNGTGWIAEKLDYSEREGFDIVRAYYGSSTYNTKQMARLIDSIVEDCKLQGIPTDTPEQISKYKEAWK